MADVETVHQSAANYRGSTVAAIALLVCSGAGYRLASARLAQDHGMPSLARGTLHLLPMQIGDWSGSEAPLSEELVRATDTDDHVSRSYVSRDGRQRISLFIGYGERLRDLMPHRPEVCYSGAGWVLDETLKTELEIADGATLPCQVHRFRRGGLVLLRIAVLNYYIVDGRFCPDVSLLRSKAWRFNTDASYMAQIQISCSSRTGHDRCENAVRSFAADSAPSIQRSLAEAIDEATASETDEQ